MCVLFVVVVCVRFDVYFCYVRVCLLVACCLLFVWFLLCVVCWLLMCVVVCCLFVAWCLLVVSSGCACGLLVCL